MIDLFLYYKRPSFLIKRPKNCHSKTRLFQRAKLEKSLFPLSKTREARNCVIPLFITPFSVRNPEKLSLENEIISTSETRKVSFSAVEITRSAKWRQFTHLYHQSHNKTPKNYHSKARLFQRAKLVELINLVYFKSRAQWKRNKRILPHRVTRFPLKLPKTSHWKLVKLSIFHKNEIFNLLKTRNPIFFLRKWY